MKYCRPGATQEQARKEAFCAGCKMWTFSEKHQVLAGRFPPKRRPACQELFQRGFGQGQYGQLPIWSLQVGGLASTLVEQPD